jgi:sugar phosphate permease
LSSFEDFRKKLSRVFYGYWVLLATAILHAMGAGEYYYGFSVFYTPIITEFGWSSAVTAGAFSLSRLEGGLEGPIIGWLVDKYGARKLMLFGLVFTGLGFILMTKVDSVLLLYLVYGGVLSIGHNTGFTHALTSMIAQWFIKKRSRAMSIYAVAAGVGGAAIVPLLAKLIGAYGWRMTAIFCGLSYWIIGIPLYFIVRDKPEDIGLLPDNMKIQEYPNLSDKTVTAEDLGLEVDFTASEAIRTLTFWKLVTAEGFRSFILGSVVLHEIPYLISIGIPHGTAASILGLMITFSIPGRLVFGWIGDFYNKRKILIGLMAVQAIGIFILSEATNILYAYAFVIIYGISYGGAVPLLLSLRGELFGRKRYATITGLLAPFRMIGSIIGPIAAGYIYDSYGSYKLAFQIFTVFALLSSISFYFVTHENESKT